MRLFSRAERAFIAVAIACMTIFIAYIFSMPTVDSKAGTRHIPTNGHIPMTSPRIPVRGR